MQIDEFCNKVFQRWRLPNETAFAEDAKEFLRGYQGEVLDRAFRRLVTEWPRKNGSPSMADVLDLCKAESPKFTRGDGAINRKEQFEWVKDRVPELLAEWKYRNMDYARQAVANGWGYDLKDMLQAVAWEYAQYEWLISNGHQVRRQDGSIVYSLRPFDPPEVHRDCFLSRKVRGEKVGNIGDSLAG
jgi:hypothetical protein